MTRKIKKIMLDINRFFPTILKHILGSNEITSKIIIIFILIRFDEIYYIKLSKSINLNNKTNLKYNMQQKMISLH